MRSAFYALYWLALAATIAVAGGLYPKHRTTKWHAVETALSKQIGKKFYSVTDVNAYVNKLPYVSDSDAWGAGDYWAEPKHTIVHGGDCEDFALLKYALLLQNGLASPDDMDLLLVRDKFNHGQPHAVLVVRGVVLDSQTDKIYAVNSPAIESRYTMIAAVNGKESHHE